MISNRAFSALFGRANTIGRFALPAVQSQRSFAKKGKKSAAEVSEPEAEEHFAEPVAEAVAAPVK